MFGPSTPYGALKIVVGEVGVQLLVELAAIGGRIEVDALLLHRAPAPLDEGIIGGAAPPVAADLAASRE